MEMEAIVSAHEAPLLRYAAGILGSSHAAQDVVQNAFIKLFREWKPGVRPTEAIRGWLYRVVHNEAVDYLRRETRLHLLHEAHAQQLMAAASANPGPDRAEQMQMIVAQIRRLSLGEQQVLLLRLQEGLSYREISEVTGRTEGNVGCLLHEAVRKLSGMMRKRAEASPVA